MSIPAPSTPHGDNPRLNAILAEYMKRKDAGQPIDRQALLKAYPDLADGLRSYFEAESMMGGVGGAAVAETIQPKAPPQSPSLRETVLPGASASDTASEFRSRSFGRYQLLRPLGEGAMGSVFLAHDSALDRKVALKIPKVDGKGSGEFLARFSREAKAAAGLKHPNVCSVYDTGEHDGTPYITMDFIDGVPLSRFVGSSQLRTTDSILQMIATIADAVEHAHSKGVVHRDLKPGNILIDAKFKPHVTDFGLARRIGPDDEVRLTQEGLLIGTPAYMAPEQVKGEQAKVGPRSDVYSLGVILFELLTLRLPFEGSVPEMLAQVLRDHPPSPSKFRKDLPEDVDDLCVKMLRKDPEKRFCSMAEVASAIGQLREKLRQAPLNKDDAARQQSPFEIEKSHIEQMLTKGQYAAAIKALEKLSREKTPGAKAAAEWARKKLPDVRAEEKSLSPVGLTALLQTAQTLFEKHDYPGTIQLLEDVPALRRTEAMEDLLEKTHAREAEAEQLLDEIKDRERSQNMEGIEVLVKRFLKLKPGNSYAKRLWQALQSYNKTSSTRRQYRFEKGRLQPMPEPGFLKQWAVLGTLVGVLVFLSVYAYVIFYLKSDRQTLAVHVDDDWLKENGGELTLLVDGNEHTISTNSPNGDGLNVTVSLGDHTFSVKSGDAVVNNPESFTIERDGRDILSITETNIELVASLPDDPGKTKTAQTNPPTPVPPSPMPPTLGSGQILAEGTTAGQKMSIGSIGADVYWCPAGSYQMGTDTRSVPVQLTKGFWLGRTEITQGQWRKVMGTEPWSGQPMAKSGDDFPASLISWELATEFCDRLTKQESAAERLPPRMRYSLPTEAQWEYACRAGTSTKYSFGDIPTDLSDYAWWGGLNGEGNTTSEQYPHRVGQKKPNNWGLHDMHGNLFEWCSDVQTEVLPGGIDPFVGNGGDNRVYRGGAWHILAERCQSGYRSGVKKDIGLHYNGFRIALVQDSTTSGSEIVKNQLKQLGLALHDYHNTHKMFPPANESRTSKLSDFTWRVLILPYLDQASTYNQINFQESWDSPSNKAVLSALPQQFDSPTLSNDQRKKGLTVFLAPIAEGTVLGHKAATNLPSITDGTTNTIMLVAAHPNAAKMWSSPGELPIDMNDPLKDLKGQPGGEFAVLLCDGSVKMLPDSIDPEVFRRLLVRNDGKEVDWGNLQSVPMQGAESLPESTTSQGNDTADRDPKLVAKDILSYTGHTNQVTSVAFSPDGKHLASSDWDKTVKIWDSENGQTKFTLQGHAGFVQSVAFSPDGHKLVSASLDQAIKVWDLDSGHELFTIRSDAFRPLCVAFSADGKHLAYAGFGGSVVVCDAINGKVQSTVTRSETVITSVAFSSDGKLLAIGGGEKTINLYDANGREQPSLTGHTEAISSFVFSSDARLLASASNDKTVKVWDILNRHELVTFKGHSDKVNSVAFFPDGKRVASCGADKSVKIFNSGNGAELLSLDGLTGFLLSVAISREGTRLAAATGKTVKLWNVEN